MRVAADAWLSETMGRPVFSVRVDGDDSAAIARDLEAHARSAAADAFFFAKVSAENVGVANALSRAGFSLIETSLTFGQPLPPRTPAKTLPGDIHVDEVRPEWRTAVLDIAGSCFRYTRFHIDPAIDLALAHHVKREWIRSYVEGRRGDRLLVAHRDDDVLGFCAMLVVERSGASVAVIDLIGVRSDQQKRGIGRALVAAAADAYAPACSAVEVGTQAINVPSVRLYEDMGFRLLRAGLVFHLHGSAPGKHDAHR